MQTKINYLALLILARLNLLPLVVQYWGGAGRLWY